MADEIRCYFVVGTGTLPAPGEQAWVSLFQACQTQPYISVLLAAARAAQNYISTRKRSQGTGFVRKFTLCGLEIDQENRADLLAALDQQSAVYGITGTVLQKLEGVLQVELRSTAIGLGYTAAQADQISVSIVGLGAAVGSPNGANREEAITETKSYLSTNSSVWY